MIDFEAILIVLLIFVPLEHLVPLHEGRRYLRRGLSTDLLHVLISGILIRIGLLTVIAASMTASALLMPGSVTEIVRDQPLWLQVLEVTLIADLGFYASHRLLHAVPFLWKFHAIHHSIEDLDAIAAHRVHPVDQIFVKSASLLPVYALGFSAGAIAIASVIYFWQSLLIHSNIRIEFGPLGRVVASPRFHHWHHANQREAFDKNFAGQLSLLDTVFGTIYLPPRFPEKYGTDEPVPPAYHQQLAYPFTRSREASAAVQSESQST